MICLLDLERKKILMNNTRMNKFSVHQEKRGEFRPRAPDGTKPRPLASVNVSTLDGLCCVLHGGSLRPLTLSPTNHKPLSTWQVYKNQIVTLSIKPLIYEMMKNKFRLWGLTVQASWEGPRTPSRGRPMHHSHEATSALWNNPAASELLNIKIISQEYILFTKRGNNYLRHQWNVTNNSLHESGVKLRKKKIYQEM